MLLVTLITVVLTALVALGLVLTGPAARGGRRRHRTRLHRRHRLEHRQVAGPARRRRPDRGAALLRHPQRPATQVPLDQHRRHRRHPHLAARLGRVRALRRELLQLRQDLRLSRRSHRLPALAVDHQPRAALRRRARRRARTRPRAPGRHARRGEHPAARPRHPQERQGGAEGTRRHRPRPPHPTHPRPGPGRRPGQRSSDGRDDAVQSDACRRRKGRHEVREAEQQVREDPLPTLGVWSPACSAG